MKKDELKNYEFHCGSRSATLSEIEIDVIVALVLKAIEERGCNISYGTFILDGQLTFVTAAQCIVRFDLPDGHLKPTEFKESKITHDYAYEAETAINNVTGCRRIDSSIRVEDWKKVLVLNTRYGRFLCSFYADFPDGGHDESTNILLIVAKAIAQMCKADKTLQNSAEDIWLAEIEDNEGAFGAAEFVDDAFDKCETMELYTWDGWRYFARNRGNFLFFK